MANLNELFRIVELPEITNVDFSIMNHVQIAKLLPAFGGQHPTKGIFVDTKTGRAFGIASGWDVDMVTHNGMSFQSGAISREIAIQAGEPWTTLGNHVEPVAAAFMRSHGIKDGLLYINGRNPCWGTPDGTGCYYRLPTFLAEGSMMIVYNKEGQDFVASQPVRRFHFVGLPN
jgi:hypothetical protein